MTARQDLGAFGERLAVARLEAEGMTIIAQNVRTKAGEIDIVAQDGWDVVFVEVRTRRGAPGASGESLDGRKVTRMWQCALEYCEREEIAPVRARVDAVLVELEAGGRVSAIDHIKALEVPD